MKQKKKQEQEIDRYDFKAFGQGIKAARKAKGISRNKLADMVDVSPRYIANIENSGQHPSLQILYKIVTTLDVSADQFFFPDGETDKSTQRRQLETLLDGISGKGLRIVTATFLKKHDFNTPPVFQFFKRKNGGFDCHFKTAVSLLYFVWRMATLPPQQRFFYLPSGGIQMKCSIKTTFFHLKYLYQVLSPYYFA